MIRRALISVYDKEGLEPFARGLAQLDVEIVASGGTAAFLKKVGLAVTPIEDVTETPELLGGRVKTLHPRIHAAILARRDRADDRDELEDHDIEPFDLVCVNLYPFEDVVSRRAVGEQDAVEMIDIGGPAMLRAAAKNFAHVAPVARPERYEEVLVELRARGELSLETRRRLAADTFALTAAYEAAIANWFTAPEVFPEAFMPGFRKELELAYGENPHQRAAYYSERGARLHLLSMVEQLHGRELSFNNLNDLSAARLVAHDFELPACAIVKHANPCGVAVAGSIEQAYERALAADPLSAYGGVVVLNRPVSEALGEKLAAQFVEVLFAPGYDETALELLRRSRRRESSRTASGGFRIPASATTSACSGACSSRSATRTSKTEMAWRSSAARRPRWPGATCSSPGGSASTSPRTRSCSFRPADDRDRRRPDESR